VSNVTKTKVPKLIIYYALAKAGISGIPKIIRLYANGAIARKLLRKLSLEEINSILMRIFMEGGRHEI
jgi:hypothetical protein